MIRTTAIFLSLLLGFASISWGSDPVVLENPGFEEDLKGWKVFDSEGSRSVVTADAAHEGEAGLRVADESETLNSRVLSAPVQVVPGKTYLLTFWARTTTSDRMGVCLRFNKADGQMYDEHNRPIIDLYSSNGEWALYTVEGVAPSEAVNLMIWIHSYSRKTGEVDFDDFSLEEDSSDAGASAAPSESAAPTMAPQTAARPALAAATSAKPVPVAPVLPAGNAQGSGPVIILKLDDLRAAQGRRPLDARWQRLGDFLRERNLKASIGIICDSLEQGNEESFEWIRSLHQSGLVEFWFHGYDHLGWLGADGKAYAEFRKRPYEEQKRRFELSQKLAFEKLGFYFTTFGPAGFIPPSVPSGSTPVLGTPEPPAFTGDNFGFDAATIRVMQEDPHMTAWLYPTPETWLYPTLEAAAGTELEPPDKITILDRVWNVNIEFPLFVPNAAKFQEGYAQSAGKRDYLVLQGHPGRWDDARFAEFVKIVDFLTAQGATFMTPSEYSATIKGAKAAPSLTRNERAK